MSKRDRHDIAMDILQSAQSGKNKTQLMRDVGLSHLQSKQYLGLLLEKGLLEVDGKGYFKTTKTGSEFLKKCGECFLCHWHQQRPTKKF
jgi:predicted transcriptional regulator